MSGNAKRIAASRLLKRKTEKCVKEVASNDKITKILEKLHTIVHCETTERAQTDLNNRIAGTSSSGESVPTSIPIRSCDDSNESSSSSDETRASNAETSDSEPSEEPLIDRSEKSTPTCSPPLRDALKTWALKYKICHNALSALLKTLRPHHVELPADSRTLLNTTRDSSAIIISEASETCYFGIREGLCEYNLNKICHTDNVVKLNVNIDGLPIFKSTGGQFWPILCQIVSTIKTPPFIASCYYGKAKPPSVDIFLGPFVQEAYLLATEGFNHEGKMYRIAINSVICDAPARAFVKCIKGHNGYFACEKCTQKGKWEKGRMVFLECVAEERSDATFINQINEEHHSGISPLLQLNIGLVSAVPLDSMHLVYLGVMRKLLSLWLKTGNRNVRIGRHQINMISERLVALKNHIPSEFNRKPRYLKDVDRFKATEFRQILLYTGPIVFNEILPQKVYNHFLILHVAISILTNPELATDENYIGYSEKLLKLFVQEMKVIYGEETVVYNVHSLVHLASEVRRYGCLENFSCFPFENYLGHVKNMLRTPNRPLSQLSRRLSEQMGRKDPVETSHIQLLKQYYGGPNPGVNGQHYKEIKYNSLRLRIDSDNDCFAIRKNENKIVRVINIVNSTDSINIVCQESRIKSDYYTYPCSSKLMSFFKIGSFVDRMVCYKLTDLKKKCIVSSEFKCAVAVINSVY